MSKDVIVACDFSSKEATFAFLQKLKDVRPYVKIGMELFYAEGPDMVRELASRGFKVFLDIKVHDIPNTAKNAVKNLATLGADIINLHSGGGIEMMKAAKEGLLIGAPDRPVKLIAVTMLTSLSTEQINRELLIGGPIEEAVVHYAKNVLEAGLDGVVCSPLEAKAVKDACGQGFLTVTPGIRYKDGKVGDQARVTTPQEAAKIGSDYIVVGRPITASDDPLQAYLRVRKDFTGE